jgi:sugar phosphate isomerase/epimerase
MISLTRRELAAALAAPLAASSGRPIRLGGPVFLKSDDPRELAHEHRRLGYSAAYCPEAKATDSIRVREIEKAFAAENVVIAEVGAWVNMLDPDDAKRAKNLGYVIERLELAEAVGARCCPDIAGSYNPKVWYGPHPRNLSEEFFEATVENCRRVIDEVKPKRTKFTIEMMGWSLPGRPGRLPAAHSRGRSRGIRRSHRRVQRHQLPGEVLSLGRVHLGMLPQARPWIVSCHAKDLAWIPEMNVHFVEVIPGRGEVDYRAYLSELSRLPADAPLMLEHLKTAEEYDEGKRYIMKVAGELGLAFA